MAVLPLARHAVQAGCRCTVAPGAPVLAPAAEHVGVIGARQQDTSAGLGTLGVEQQEGDGGHGQAERAGSHGGGGTQTARREGGAAHESGPLLLPCICKPAPLPLPP